jgi:hypothetical protein
MEKEGGGSGAGAVEKALTRGKQREDVGAGGGARLAVRALDRRGRQLLEEGEGPDGWVPHASRWREREEGWEGLAGWADWAESEGRKEGFCFFYYFSTHFQKHFQFEFSNKYFFCKIHTPQNKMPQHECTHKKNVF